MVLVELLQWYHFFRLDELPEFSRNVLEVMRQPLEDRIISISRAKYSTEYPASFMLVASMNPCPCGYYGHPKKKCVCNEYQRSHYMSKISGPLLNRMNMSARHPQSRLHHYRPRRHPRCPHLPLQSSTFNLLQSF